MTYERPDIVPESEEWMERQEKRGKWAAQEADKLKARRDAEKQVEAEERQGRQAVARALSSYTPGNIEWLWSNRIPIGEITMLAGKAGIGKSTLMSTWASWLTVGEMQGAYYGSPQNVIYVPNEDSVEKALLPRLMAAEADLDRVYTMHIANSGEECPLVLPEDCDRLAQMSRDLDAVAVFLDPLSSNMSDKDRNKPEVRKSYERLRRCAENNRIAVVGNGHLKKGASGDLLEGILGSSEIGNVVRAALGVLPDPDSDDLQMILSQCKNNYGPMNLRSYVYQIAPKDMWTEYGTIHGTYIDWQESTDRQVNDLMRDSMSEGAYSHSDVAEAVEWLRGYLSMNPGATRKDIFRDGGKEGIKEHTIKRAAKKLRVQTVMSGFPATSRWYLTNPQVTEGGTGGT